MIKNTNVDYGNAVILSAGMGGGTGSGAGYVASENICAREIKEFLLNHDLGIIDDDNITLLNEIKKLNQSLDILNLEIREKSNISAKIVASTSSSKI